jgi:hypothetical protein
MTKRYAIVGRMLGGTDELVLCEVYTNPELIMMALRAMPAGVGRRGKRVRKYDWVRAIDRERSNASATSGPSPAS